MVKVRLSGSLAQIAGDSNVNVDASRLNDALEKLAVTYGKDFRTRIFDDQGKPRRFINIYVNNRDYRYIKRLETELQEGDTVSIIPAVSGG